MRRVKTHRTLTFALAAALSGVLVACGGSTAAPTTSGSPTSASPAATTTTAGAAAEVTTGVSNGQNYAVARSTTGDATADGTGRWTLVVDTISGGDEKVSDTFNRAVQTSVQGQLDQVKREAGGDGTWSFDTKPEIFFGSAAVSELISGLYNHVPSAHPVSYVSTVVVDSRSATPITLKELFSDEQAGLNRLSQQTKQLLPAVMGVGASPMPDAPGNAPVEANFANWIPTANGLEIHFADYQFAHGLLVLTVPWSALDDLLAPGMAALRQP